MTDIERGVSDDVPAIDPVTALHLFAATAVADANQDPSRLTAAQHRDVSILQMRAGQAASAANCLTPSLLAAPATRI